VIAYAFSMSAVPADQPPIRLGVSSCLLGNEVRFDGQQELMLRNHL
jgi:hypothetical protein